MKWEWKIAGYLLVFVLHQVFQTLAADSTNHVSATHDPQALPKQQPMSKIHALFQVRSGQTLSYPPIDIPGPKPRKAWLDAYRRAKQAGHIPSIPRTIIVDYKPVYPSWYKNDPCNYSISKCSATDICYPPPGIAAATFDDGPQPDSRQLLAFLTKNSQKATHFLIGSRILNNMQIFKELDQSGQHLACHTYSHPMLTSLTDEEIVGELGWVMQVMYDNTSSHKLCSYWRPPSGDIDDRVRAIARSVFGLTAIIWSADPRDWCLSDAIPSGSVCSQGNGPQSLAELKAELNQFVRVPKSRGIMILHHEQSTRAIIAYKDIYPVMKKLRWEVKTVPDFLGKSWYQ